LPNAQHVIFSVAPDARRLRFTGNGAFAKEIARLKRLITVPK
jgi:hypothetical protein